MQLNREGLRDTQAWQNALISVPAYDVSEMAEKTKKSPIWVHFGAGNIFRGFIASLQQRLLNEGLAEKGIIAAESFDFDIIDKIYEPFDNLTLNVILNSDASVACEVIASVAEALRASADTPRGMERLAAAFESDSLQMASFTITEKGYALTAPDGKPLPAVKADMENGFENPRHILGILTALLYKRYQAGGYPLALVSMDNCSKNGERLQAGVLEMANAWLKNGVVNEGFIGYLSDAKRVSFPWSMIDKITPRPSEAVTKILADKGVSRMEPVVTDKGTFIAPFVNAEAPQYLVIEDSFPNGRPALERAGVYMTDRETVNKVERMKVTTCLNPLHTAMSVIGCLLGYTLISQEMKDKDIVALIKRLGYTEGLPVVTDPGILSPEAFINEVVNERLPNPFMPDAPQRIATDTSQKVGIRFGETIKSYIEQGKNLDNLAAIPLAIAGWLRYLLAVDDNGMQMEVSQDPLKDELQQKLSGIVWDKPESYGGQLKEILSNEAVFGTDLTKTCLSGKIESIFAEMLNGKGAVRRALQKHLS